MAVNKVFFFAALLSILFMGANPILADDIFNIKKILAPPLHSKLLKRTEKNNIVTEEVMFHSETDGAKKVDIFAYFSYPKGAKNLPGLIWNQGGLYKATTYWTEFGAKRGYATLCIDFPLPGYRSTGAYPITSGLELGGDPRQAPIYHGAVALLRAVSYLESRREVDRTRIGMAGSSWGGFYTTMMVGLDPRLKAGSSMFGCGGLHLGNLWWDGNGWDKKRDKKFRDRWMRTLDPARRLRKSKTPIAWFSGTNDQFYWMPALMHSHTSAAGPAHLSLLANWNHALTPELDEQVFAWLDVHLKKAKPYLKVSPIEIKRERKDAFAVWKFSGPRKVVSADLMLSYGKSGNWQSRYWIVSPAQISKQTCRADIPAGGLPYYISGSVTDANGFRYSTPIRFVDPAKLGLSQKTGLLDYDGCSLWGDFEPEQITTCRRQGWPVASIKTVGAKGKQYAVVKGGIWQSPPILGTTSIPHRLSCSVRADGPTIITMTIKGRFDGKAMQTQKKFAIGKKWQRIAVPFTPPEALTMSLRLAVSTPKNMAVSIDDVQFRPKGPKQ